MDEEDKNKRLMNFKKFQKRGCAPRMFYRKLIDRTGYTSTAPTVFGKYKKFLEQRLTPAVNPIN